MTMKEASENIGRNVVYTPFKGCSNDMKETGTIKSVNNRFVFIRYSYSDNAIATSPEDLEFEID